jgi:hypothetical protein
MCANGGVMFVPLAALIYNLHVCGGALMDDFPQGLQSGGAKVNLAPTNQSTVADQSALSDLAVIW